MILEQLTVENFCAFRGRHQLDCSAVDPQHPIILIGGLNGAGKTTLLDALQLALYGKLARTNSRGALAYPDYLGRSIHQAAVGTGASVAVRLRVNRQGQPHTMEVMRSWERTGSGVREQVDARCDGESDRYLSEHWLEWMEELLPARLAPLFFFDGEQIESLADPTASSHMLATAVQALLGLDLVDQLQSDLLLLERRHLFLNGPEAARREIEEQQARLLTEAAALEVQRTAVTELERTLALLRQEIREVEERYQAQGGLLVQEQLALEQRQQQVEEEVREATAKLRSLAEGAAPLLLVTPLLRAASQQAEQEQRIQAAALLSGVLQERDEHLLESLAMEQLPAPMLHQIERWLTADRAARTEAVEIPVYLQLDATAWAQLRSFQEPHWSALRRELEAGLELLDERRLALEDLQRQRTATPESDAVDGLKQRREQLLTEIERTARQLVQQQEQLQTATVALEQQRRRFISRLTQHTEAELARQDADRFLDHSRNARSTLSRFRRTVLVHHCDRLATEIFDCYRQLLHKQTLLTDLAIDPESFSLRIHSCTGTELSTASLSAGERQLLAVAILWGLGRASGRHLPVVIDTPLGRLDSLHRRQLLERYFPRVSHQVVLLSTDKEIDRPAWTLLRPYLGQSYRLQFDAASQSSRIELGYEGDLG